MVSLQEQKCGHRYYKESERELLDVFRTFNHERACHTGACVKVRTGNEKAGEHLIRPNRCRGAYYLQRADGRNLRAVGLELLEGGVVRYLIPYLSVLRG